MSSAESRITVSQSAVDEIAAMLDKFNALLTSVHIAVRTRETDLFSESALAALHDNYETLNSVILDYLAPAGTESCHE